MPPLLAREPGPVGVALAGPDLVAGVIADGHHLHPATLSAFWRALGPDRFLAVSDTTAALGLPDGPARLGDQEVVVADGTVRLADGTLAGSAASLIACLEVLDGHHRLLARRGGGHRDHHPRSTGRRPHPRIARLRASRRPAS